MDRIAGFDRVTVYGGATIDRIGRTAGPPVPGASNPGTVRSLAGGVGLNVASVLARLGLRTTLVARVGRDSDGEAITAAARFAGVATHAIGLSPDAPTATYQAAFDNEGGLILGIAAMDIYGELTPSVIAPAVAEATENEIWVVDANLPDETLAFLVEEAAAARRPVAALTVSPVKALHLLPFLDRVTWLFANRKEAAALLGKDLESKTLTAVNLAGELVAEGVRHAIVTDGGHPLAAASPGESRAFMPLRATVTSVNGAGDSLAAGTLFGLSTGKALNEAVRLGIAACALTLESGGVAAAPFDAETLFERAGGRRPST